MSKKRHSRKIIENVTILEAVAEGKCIARVDDKVLFVPFAAPGDIVDVEIYRQKHNYMEGRVLRIAAPSPLRVQPPCSHFGLCGGCKWQHLDYAEQLKFKEKQVRDQLMRIGKVELPESEPILGSSETLYYRNKLEYTFSPRKWFIEAPAEGVLNERTIENTAALGFHLPQKFDKILDIEHCCLQPAPSNEIRLFLKEYALQKGYAFYSVRSASRERVESKTMATATTAASFATAETLAPQNNFTLRNVIIRNAKSEFMVILVVSECNNEAIADILDALSNEFPQIISLYYVVNNKVNDSISDLEAVHYKGEKFLTAEMPAFVVKSLCGFDSLNSPKNADISANLSRTLKFRINPKSFYQTNTEQAYRLYGIVAEMAALKSADTVYDLYTGTGTIALFIADSVKHVTGIEYVEEAVADARKNAVENGIENANFFAGDMAKILTDDFVVRSGAPNVVITDPPREGMHPEVVEMLLSIAPERIVYVSCNAATQARDIEKLSAQYRIIRHRAVDMFPHTAHVESVVLLEMNSLHFDQFGYERDF
ncbi:MAG: class I SAM-dependent RNA methyltransferase [Bacteroidales bacterium]|jgi:23S rRNA (uracil1939-C5)-methyltransferase|nr:class I SAM-dependent RNA methyltransferase [Bacteroidales bacterium]